MLPRSVLVAAAAVLTDSAHAWSARGVGRRQVLRQPQRRVALLLQDDTAAAPYFPDERTRRAVLEAAFTQIDNDGSASLDKAELYTAGFDAEYVLAELDANKDGRLSRDEFVDSLVALYSVEGPCSVWEQDDLVSLRKRNEMLPSVDRVPGGSVWGSRTVRRAITEPRFELVSLVAVLVTSMCYAVGTLNDLTVAQRFWLLATEDFFYRRLRGRVRAALVGALLLQALPCRALRADRPLLVRSTPHPARADDDDGRPVRLPLSAD